MADNVPQTPEEVAAANAAVIEAQRAQDINGSVKIGDSLDARTSLDSIRDQIIKDQKAAADDADPAPLVEPAAPAAKEPVTPAATPPVTPAATEPAAAPVVTPPAEPSAEEIERKRLKEQEDTLFKDTPTLPPNASPKSSQAFSAVKLRATQEISKLSQELDTLKSEKAALEEKLKQPIPDEIGKELEELRQFRAKLDVDADPKFKEFDKNISQAHDFIYAQLKKSPNISDDIIAAIKQHGGPENVKMEKVLDTVNDPMIRRLVESKLADIEMTKFSKDQAIKKSKEDIKGYLAEREKQFSEVSSSHNTVTRKTIDTYAANLPWMKPATVDQKADEASRKSAEAHNAYIEKTKKEIELAVQDDSPEMRATLIIGMAQLFRLQTIHEGVLKSLETEKAARAEAEKTVSRLKSASTSRLRDSEAVNPGQNEPKKTVNLLESAGEALDRMRKEKLQQRAA